MKKSISLTYIVFSLLLAAAVFFAASCDSFKAPSDDTEAVSDGTLAGCLFIGDSRTEGLRMTGSLLEADFFCAVGQTVFDITDKELSVDGEYYDLARLLSEREYDKIYILLGINEISSDLDEVAHEYSGLIDFILEYQPGVKIIVQANPHVTTSRSKWGDAFNNDNVNLLNQKLEALTNGFTVCWLDANPILDDASGGLSEEYAEEDGIHPNWGCYVMWGEWIVSRNGNY